MKIKLVRLVREVHMNPMNFAVKLLCEHTNFSLKKLVRGSIVYTNFANYELTQNNKGKVYIRIYTFLLSSPCSANFVGIKNEN